MKGKNNRYAAAILVLGMILVGFFYYVGNQMVYHGDIFNLLFGSMLCIAAFVLLVLVVLSVFMMVFDTVEDNEQE